MMRSAAWLITTACAAQALGYLSAVNEHAGEAQWSAHAQFHWVEALVWIAALNLAMIVLAWGPLQRAERWSLRLVTALFAAAHGAHWLAKLAVPDDQRFDPLVYTVGMLAMALLGAAGLALAWWAASARSALARV
ncbi:MAG TPA: hypothetical protein PKD53_16815 [Chloroflexaceae bacterium]|nr:hypothetical protein [Chloroflexaceae bacterium]